MAMKKKERCYTTISTADLDRETWLRLRQTGIGGSDVAGIAGLSPWSNPMSVYRNKTSDELDYEDSEAMRQGRDLEDYVAHRFMEETGLKVVRSNKMYRSARAGKEFMLADVDRLVVGEDAGLECKTASAYNADKWSDNQTPIHYLLQVFHYMYVTGKRTWYIAVVILGVGFQYRKIEWDDEIIANLVAIETAFWEQHIVPRRMPEPDGSKVCSEIIQEYFKNAEKDSQIPLVGFDERLKRREELVELIERLGTEKQLIEQEVQLYLKNASAGISEKYRVSWPVVETSRLDTKRIKEERPDIYKEYSKTTTSRRFTVKVA